MKKPKKKDIPSPPHGAFEIGYNRAVEDMDKWLDFLFDDGTFIVLVRER